MCHCRPALASRASGQCSTDEASNNGRPVGVGIGTRLTKLSARTLAIRFIETIGPAGLNVSPFLEVTTHLNGLPPHDLTVFSDPSQLDCLVSVYPPSKRLPKPLAASESPACFLGVALGYSSAILSSQ